MSLSRATESSAHEEENVKSARRSGEMMVAVHALTGAVLGTCCPRRSQAFWLGVASHLVADALPHRDLDIPAEAVGFGLSLAAVAALKGTRSPAFAGAMGAVAPDVENLIGRLLHIPDEKLLVPSHRWYHGRKLTGLGNQVLLASACLAFLTVTKASHGARR